MLPVPYYLLCVFLVTYKVFLAIIYERQLMVVQVMFRPSNERERMLGRILALLFCTSIRIALCISVYVEIIKLRRPTRARAPLKLGTQYIARTTANRYIVLLVAALAKARTTTKSKKC